MFPRLQVFWVAEQIKQPKHGKYTVLRTNLSREKVCLPEYHRFWQHSCYFWTRMTWIIFGTVISSEQIALKKKKRERERECEKNAGGEEERELT